MALKAPFNLSRDCFDSMMTVFGHFHPEGHIMAKTLYESKKILHALKMPYEQIHACPKGCVLFRKDYVDDNYCPKCKSSRYVEVDHGDGQKKQSKIPINVLRYHPVIPRIQRLYINEEAAKQMTWHKDGIRYETDEHGREMMIYPSDGQAWNFFDFKHPEKAERQRMYESALEPMGSIVLI